MMKLPLLFHPSPQQDSIDKLLVMLEMCHLAIASGQLWHPNGSNGYL